MFPFNATVSMKPYEYKPLGSGTTIRVLVLSPSTDMDHNTPLDCRIVHMDRASLWATPGDRLDPSTAFYDAVSYTWGAADFSEQLPIDNSSYLHITPIVKAMLCSFRHRSKARRLWIDAICLNQADNAEKAVQIPLMGDIYRQATKVRIWLGEADSSIPYAFAALRNLASRGAALSDEMVASLDSFLKRPWFSRRWIIQEAAVSHARTVYCGQHKISWEWMLDAFEVLLADRGVVDNPSPAAVIEANLWSAVTIRKRIPNLLSLLWEFDKSVCSDRHDTIYAMMGLARVVADVQATGASQGVTVPIDYEMHWATTYAHLAKSLMDNGHERLLFDHLLAFGSLYDEDSSLPSWVPSWNQARKFTVPSVVFENKHGERAAAWPILKLPKNQEDDGAIMLTNWHCSAIVERVGDIFEELGACIAQGEGTKRVEFRSLGLHPVKMLLLDSIEEGHSTIADKQNLPPNFWEYYKDALYSELIEELKEHKLRGPYLFLDLGGWKMALARNTVRPGDLVLSFHHQLGDFSIKRRLHSGSEVHFGVVLRLVEDSKDRDIYRFIGPCSIINGSEGAAGGRVRVSETEYLVV